MYPWHPGSLNRIKICDFQMLIIVVSCFIICIGPSVSSSATQQGQTVQVLQLPPGLHRLSQPGGAPVHTHGEARQAVLLWPVQPLLHLGTVSVPDHAPHCTQRFIGPAAHSLPPVD